MRTLPMQRIGFAEGCRSHASPIWRVPEDIISTIFLINLPDVFEEGEPGMSSKHSAVAASHVCRDWRRLVLNTPLFWSSLHLRIPGFGEGKSVEDTVKRFGSELEKCKGVVATWLLRSGSCPLKLRVDSPYVPQYCIRAHSQLHTVLIDLIYASAYRWKHIRFNFFLRTAHMLRLLEIAPKDVPLIETIHAELYPLQGYDTSAILDKGLFRAPSLRVLHLNPWRDILARELKGLVWTSVTDLHVDTVTKRALGPVAFDDSDTPFTSSHQVLELLRAFPNLVRGSFYLEWEDEHTYAKADTPVVTLRHLKALTLEGYPPCRGFASRLLLPSLRTLEIRSDLSRELEWPISRMGSGLVELIEHCGEDLDSLTIWQESLDKDALGHCLTYLPNLEKLRILETKHDLVFGFFGSCGFAQTKDIYLLDRLSQRFQSPGSLIDEALYLPKLQVLEICLHNCSGDHIEKAFVAFIIARRKCFDSGMGCIRDVHVTLHRRGNVDIVQELQDVDAGANFDNFVLRITAPKGS
ncbi:hypothetical protein D9611_001662 [Ephemerocybe angulata]|uniref:F-box domain-containing protein n=1 Tax=Ephemerocybe angulata TaxID=980116 RepID=A0A8H5CIQ4_9AGAR|nr:hypothetical protein D9611_001662 [Tulosesus angulatus]